MDRGAVEITVSSQLDAAPATVWGRVTTPEGINDEPAGGGCLITDRVRWQPRLGVPGRALRPLIGFTFRHRHRRLQRHFGGAPC
jgi:hypothetical protein